MSWIKVKRVGDRAICQCPTDHHKEPSRRYKKTKGRRTKEVQVRGGQSVTQFHLICSV